MEDVRPARDDARSDFTAEFEWPLQGRVSGRFAVAAELAQAEAEPDVLKCRQQLRLRSAVATSCCFDRGRVHARAAAMAGSFDIETSGASELGNARAE